MEIRDNEVSRTRHSQRSPRRTIGPLPKSLWAVVLGFALFLPHVSTGEPWCANIAGDWRDHFTSTYNLSQNGTSVSGTASLWWCIGSSWTVTGIKLATGPFFDLDLEAPPGSMNIFTGLACESFRAEMDLHGGGCDTANGRLISGDDEDHVNWFKTCDAPDGESSSPLGWADDEGLPTIHKWQGNLTPSSTNFAGREVYEEHSGEGAAIDTCWFEGSMIPQFTGVTGGSWTIDDATPNLYGADYVGWGPRSVRYYRQLNRAPCSLDVPQTMMIRCNFDLDIAYQTHPLVAWITLTAVGSSRDRQATQRIWP